MGKIQLNNIRVHARHGCLDEESIIGSDYRVDIEMDGNLSKAVRSDSLKDTADYVLLQKIVKQEMAVKSKLLEHVAGRILNRVFEEIPLAAHAKVSVSKINPPIGGDVESVSVILESSR